MIIGIDVGGTNIDGVIIENRKVAKKVKRPVDKENLFDTVYGTLKDLMHDADKSKVRRIHLSTTISTNAIVENTIEDVLLIIQSGPGIQNDFSQQYEHVELIDGYVDHRGKVVKDLNLKEIDAIKNDKKYKSFHSLGVVTKFSTRNPESETKIKDLLKDDFEHISVGHALSGNLNFPRRVATTFLNASVTKVFSSFLDNIVRALQEEEIFAPIYILKADGGTMGIDDAYRLPVQSVLSGPAASFMGISALEETLVDSIYLDIGGTTTDIFFLADGMPLFEPLGIEIDGRKTLIRSIFCHSIGLGGDSAVRVAKGELFIGPERLDSPLALGGKYSTVTDAMAVLHLIDFGDREKSLEGIRSLARELGLPEEETARKILEGCAEKISETVENLLEKINGKPLFTVREVLENRKLEPKEIKVIGGPAKVLAPFIEKKFGLNTVVTKNSEIANAIGAALSKPTFEINLHADTAARTLSVPEANIYKKISGRFSPGEGRDLVIDLLEKKGASIGEEDFDVEIVEEDVFNMIDGFSSGKNIRIKGQIRPSLLHDMRSDTVESEK